MSFRLTILGTKTPKTPPPLSIKYLTFMKLLDHSGLVSLSVSETEQVCNMLSVYTAQITLPSMFHLGKCFHWLCLLRELITKGFHWGVTSLQLSQAFSPKYIPLSFLLISKKPIRMIGMLYAILAVVEGVKWVFQIPVRSEVARVHRNPPGTTCERRFGEFTIAHNMWESPRITEISLAESYLGENAVQKLPRDPCIVLCVVVSWYLIHRTRAVEW